MHLGLLGHVKYGVPQESTLGCLLFVLNINDTTEYVRDDVMMNFFADNTVLSLNGDSICGSTAKVNKEQIQNSLFHKGFRLYNNILSNVRDEITCWTPSAIKIKQKA